MSVGRNDPCPCGSGRKYKRCHFEADAAARPRAPGRHPIHELDHRLTLRITEFAGQRFPDDVEAAAQMLEEHPRMSADLAVPWLAYVEHYGGRTAVDWFLEEEGPSLSSAARNWLEAQRRGWLSVWQVIEVDRGRSLLLRDELTGTARRVEEVSASESADPNLMMLARVVDGEDFSVLAGTHPVPLYPFDGLQVVERVRKALRRRTAVNPDLLRSRKVTDRMLVAWSEVILRRSRRPELTNTDGDPILMTIDRWNLEPPARAEVAARIAALGGVEQESDDVLVFLRDDDTLLGRAVLGERALSLETNSIRRADVLQERIGRACAGLLGRRMRSHADPLSDAQDAGAIPEADVPAEEKSAIIRTIKEQHYESWLDIPVPALGDLTPRAAVRTARGRERVVKLLQQIELMESNAPEAERYEVARLRRELGLE